MKKEDQVCTLVQARKLVELDVKLSTLFYWVVGNDEPRLVSSDQVRDAMDVEKYPAPTVAELGMLLPWQISLEDEDLYLQGTIGNRQGEFYYIWFQSSIDNVEWELFPAIERDTEAEARAEALIWLIENEFAKPAALVL